ncbi:AbrB/MazE/SpoVT family DNA-binding domain-containing protein [Pseudomonas syringae]|uniref:AbrB/MazE/SpoVT family DNA-binding domain-containing protein n=1 Tax=Pseudomonas syringae TaxID=317 RepID=UPI001F98FB27|nr:AbrB/MazE/SpoVT family DNA-binding domain-containing protein [Pseudomonas syringae]MCF5706864.1 AbrB/MazE/SpoVT family DNA-binding domain-containing protein [Pseudomonas syringae]
MEQSTVFKGNRSQAVRLPKALALPDDVIAGHARSIGLETITNYLREFRRVEGLRVDDRVAQSAVYSS